MNKLFLIDAYALIYRSYYAFIKNPRVNSKGVNTSAIMGFCNTLNEVLTKENPTHIGVAFDSHGPTFRHEAYAPYKAQRQETPEDIKISIPIIKKILQAYRIPVLEMQSFEADDIIGTIAKKAEKEGITTFMLTPDKDYAQLVSKNVFMYRPQHGGGYEILGEKEVNEKYSVNGSSQIIELLALMGDSADNFPGCPGVGEKTAIKLIQEFGTVENIIANSDKLRGSLKLKVKNAVEDIKISKFLATINTNVPIGIGIEKLQVSEPNEKEVEEIFNELEFKSLLKRSINKIKKSKNNDNLELSIFDDFTTDGTVDEKKSSYKNIKSTPHDYQIIDNQEGIIKILHLFSSCNYLCFDTETTSLNPIDAELVGISFSIKEGQAFYIPISSEHSENEGIINLLKPIFHDDKILKIGQNMKYDIEVLSKYGIKIRGKLFDTMIAHYLIQPELRHNMDYMAEIFLNYETIHIEELIGEKGKNQLSMRSLNPTEIYEYACEDADITLQLKNVLEPKLKENGVDELFWNIEMPLVPVLAEMEMNGVRLDTDALNEVSISFTNRLLELEHQIFELAGETFNIASPKQVGDILFGKMKIVDKAKKTKTGQFVTSEEVLQQLRNKHEIVDYVLQHRGLKKLLGTYVEALPKLINQHTGHIHTSFNQTITSTGRLSSSDPNLQNIPVRGEDGKEIRKCFIPEEGQLFFSADYSQIELRVMAHLSQDKNMQEAFKSGHDIHTATAARIYHEDIDAVTRDQRNKAKRANFGIIYGITVFGLSERLEISRDEAKKLIEGYFATFPEVRQYMEKSKEEARKKGYAETLFRRRRYLADLYSHNVNVRNYAERNAINAPIQGSAADIIKVAMINIHKRFQQENIQSKMILQVHDELNFSVLPEEKEKVERIVIEEMENAYPLSVPLTAEFGWGSNWLEAH
ncbi:MAG: DNA polymerase I [Prevotella sp.]|nr:DNA polymerase I [Prevotella sp.]